MLQPEILALMIPIIALSIPIVAMLLKHQREMAELMNGQKAIQPLMDELGRLRAEVGELRERVNMSVLETDTLRAVPMTPPVVPEDVRARIQP